MAFNTLERTSKNVVDATCIAIMTDDLSCIPNDITKFRTLISCFKLQLDRVSASSNVFFMKRVVATRFNHLLLNVSCGCSWLKALLLSVITVADHLYLEFMYSS